MVGLGNFQEVTKEQQKRPVFLGLLTSKSSDCVLFGWFGFHPVAFHPFERFRWPHRSLMMKDGEAFWGEELPLEQ